MNLPLQLDRSAPVPLQDQLFEKLRQLILSGRLKPNTRVIATRFLAEQAGVSRRTVLFAYERLIAEGYLETRPAIGTFVSPTPPGQVKRETANTAAVDVPRQAALYPPSLRAPAKPDATRSSHRIDFSCQHQDCSLHLPQKVWLRWMREVLMADPGIFANPGPVAGAETLRKVIATYLGATRGVLATPEQVVIVSGRRQAASLVSHLFQRAGDKVIVEAPGDKDIAEFFRLRRADLIGVPVDEFGLDVEALPQGNAALAYITPSRQNPVGGAIPQERRTQLIEWARSAGAYIIEDDSDCELRYFGAAPLPLTAMDPYGLVFYIGSFSKTLGAGINLGYLLVPPEFIGDILAIKAMAGESGQYFEQMVVANLLASGEYDHHLRRLRKVYLERRDSLITALKTYFGNVELFGTEAGTQMTWLLPPHFPSASQICEAASARGVHLAGVVDPAAQASRFYGRALILCYAALTAERMEEGIAILSGVLGGLRA